MSRAASTIERTTQIHLGGNLRLTLASAQSSDGPRYYASVYRQIVKRYGDRAVRSDETVTAALADTVTVIKPTRRAETAVLWIGATQFVIPRAHHTTVCEFFGVTAAVAT